jgi:hypothetical protein
MLEASVLERQVQVPSATQPAASRARRVWRALSPTLLFLSAFAFLNAMSNARYPEDEPRLWFVIPSIDGVFLLTYLALLGWNGWRMPKLLRFGLAFFLLFVRLLRVADGVQAEYFLQQFNFYSDLPLVPELVRFAHSTLALWQFCGLAALVLAALLALFWLSYRALGLLERSLAERRHVLEFAALCSVFLCLGFVDHDPYYEKLYAGGFAASVFPRLKYEAKFLRNVLGYKSEILKGLRTTEANLLAKPRNLSKLRGANVFLIFIESYGETVIEKPSFRARVAPIFGSFERDLGARGFGIASGLMDSATYGGHSWLAHATLTTGVRTSSQLLYELVLSQRPRALASFFHDAGYHTLNVQPGTTRQSPRNELLGFDQRYYASDFDYRGPRYAWATMPDQYVLDFVRRRAATETRRGLFVQIVLVSSHAPWSDQPLLLKDWSRIGDGAVYRRLRTVRYPVQWPYFENASEAYARSVVYDLTVLERFIAQFVTDDSLLILLGDHQPVAEVNGHSPSMGVPVHVISRAGEFLDPFLARGYVRGMWPSAEATHTPMEDFLPEFLEDFSSAEPLR